MATVGITCDLAEAKPGGGGGGVLRAQAALAYAEMVMTAGGVPVMLPPVEGLVDAHIALCDAFVLTGGDDPRTEPFGEPTHPAAVLVRPERQAYETRLLRTLAEKHPEKPVLGVCLGMQMMALVAGGSLDQHMPETMGEAAAARHRHNAEHGIVSTCELLPSAGGVVTSHHRQCVTDPGSLRIAARADDGGGVIEAIVDPARPFYLGVQWHPERTADAGLGVELFKSLIKGRNTPVSLHPPTPHA